MPKLSHIVMRAAAPIARRLTGYRGLSVGVRGLVWNEAGELLLIKHSYLPGWHFPGGGVELGETVHEAVARELREEGGVDLLAPPRLIGVFHNAKWTRGDHVAFFEA